MCLPLSQASVLSDSRGQTFHPTQPSEQKTAGKAMCWHYFHDKRCISKYLLNWDMYVNSLGSLRMALLRIILNFCFKAKKKDSSCCSLCVFLTEQPSTEYLITMLFQSSYCYGPHVWYLIKAWLILLSI